MEFWGKKLFPLLIPMENSSSCCRAFPWSLFSWINPFPLKKTPKIPGNERSKFPMLHPWEFGNLGLFDPSCGFISQIPAWSFPGILEWIGNGSWEFPELVTPHRFFPKGKKKNGEEGFSLFSPGFFGHSHIPFQGFGPLPGHQSSVIPKIPALPNPGPGPGQRWGFYGIMDPVPRAPELIPDPSRGRFPGMSSQSHGWATPSGWDGPLIPNPRDLLELG